jgi:hypothetical protein
VSHTCHWPGCPAEVDPRLFACRKHWFAIPKPLRDAIWREYRPGQEITKDPSREYVEVARQVREWIERHPRADRQLSLFGGAG